MIPLGAGDIPANGGELAERAAAAVGALIATAGLGHGISGAAGGGRPVVECEMGSVESIRRLSVNLTSMESAAVRAEKPGAFTKLGGVMLEDFQVAGNPVMIHGAPVCLDISGKNLPMTWARDDKGNLWLAPDVHGQDAGATFQGQDACGAMEISSEIAQIEAAVRRAAEGLAEANGARLKDLRLRIESAGPRSLALRVDLAAAKFMMTAKVHAIVEVVLDDEMNLRIDRLDVTGDGAAGSMVVNMLADKISTWRGKEIVLGQYMFAGAALEDVHVEVDDHIRMKARFGKS